MNYLFMHTINRATILKGAGLRSVYTMIKIFIVEIIHIIITLFNN